MRITAPDSVSISVATSGEEARTEFFDFIVIACDPRLVPMDRKTILEEEINQSLVSSTFHTALVHVRLPHDCQDYVDQARPKVRLNTDILSARNGGVHAYRDELLTHCGDSEILRPDSSWITTYQVQDKPFCNSNQDEVRQCLDQQLQNAFGRSEKYSWINWNQTGVHESQAANKMTVDYFPHFDAEQLLDSMPWKIFNSQGENRTLYISSFTCFESVLHCYLYQNMLMEQPHVVAKFPQDRNARIAVLGAGPSGILFASQQLLKKGYHNFVVYESSDRYGGKSNTVDIPVDNSEKGLKTPAELGTCYLSGAYFPLLQVFEKYGLAETIPLDDANSKFMTIHDSEIKCGSSEGSGIDYNLWCRLKTNILDDVVMPSIMKAILRYIAVHLAIMGMGPRDPMPRVPPSASNAVTNTVHVLRALRRERERFVSKRVKNCMDGEKANKCDDGGFPVFSAGLMDKIIFVLTLAMDIAPPEDLGLELEASDVLSMSFAEFINKAGLSAIEPILDHAFAIQGYGNLNSTPAYYGLLWVTPYMFIGDVYAKIMTRKAQGATSKRATVWALKNGWGHVWSTIAEEDLKGKIQLNTRVALVSRSI